MKLFQRYVFWSLVKKTFGISLIITGMLCLAQSIRFVKYFFSQKAFFSDIALLFFLLIPKLLILSLSFSFFIVLIWRYEQMMERKEYIVMKGYGVQDTFFWLPSFYFSIVLTLVTLILSFHCAPVFTTLLKEKEFSLNRSFSTSLVIPGAVFEMDKRLIYVHKQIAPLSFEGIIISDHRNPKRMETLTGQKAWVIPGKKGLSVVIHQGTHQIAPFQEKAPSFLTFKHYTVTLDGPQGPKSRIRNANEFGLDEILGLMNKTGEEAEKGLKTLHSRILFPLLSLFYGTWVPFFILKQTISRTRKYFHLIWITLSSLSVYSFFILSYKKNFSKIFTLTSYGLCAAPFALWMLYGLWKFFVNRKNNV